LAALEQITASAQIGVTITKVQIEDFKLKNDEIMEELNKITLRKMETQAAKSSSERTIAIAEAKLRSRAKEADANALVRKKEAEAEAAERDIRMRSENSARIEQNKAEQEIQKLKAETAMQIEADRAISEAESRAKAISAITEAEYQKKVKQADAASKMPAQELELKKLELQVQMLEKIGGAAWKYPDIYTGFLKEFGDKMRMGPMTAEESLAKLSSGGGDGGVYAGSNPLAALHKPAVYTQQPVRRPSHH